MIEFKMIGLDRVKPSPTQPRKHFDAGKDSELKQSMEQHGFTLSVLLVRPLPATNGFPTKDVLPLVAACTASTGQFPAYARELGIADRGFAI